MSEPDETAYLNYRGNKVPRVIRLAWTIFIVFCVVYLAKYLWPDLKEWISALNK